MSAARGQVGLVGGRPLPGRLELPHAVPAVLAFPLCLMRAHPDHGVDAPSSEIRCPSRMLDADRPDLELAFIELEDDAADIVSLRVNDFV